MFFKARKSRRLKSFRSNGVAVTQTELFEGRLLLSADVELETVLTGTGTGYAEVDYKADKDEQSLKLEIYNVAPTTYSVWVGPTKLDDITVDSSRILEVEYNSKAQKDSKRALPSGLTFSKGTEIRLVPPPSATVPTLKGNLGVKGEDSPFTSCVRLNIATAGGVVVESEYEAEAEGRKLEVTVWNLAAGSTHRLTIGGFVAAEEMKATSLGTARLRFSDRVRPGFEAFPKNFPAVVPGTALSLGTVASGNYVAMSLTPPDAPVSGSEVRIPLIGTGPLKGLIAWETSAAARQFKVEVWGGASGASIPVNIQPLNGASVQVGVIVLNSKGYGRLQFESTDANKQFPQSFPNLSFNTLFTVGTSLSGVYTTTSQSLTPDDRSAREAYQIDQTLNLSTVSTLYENHWGKGEKWMKDKAGNWYFITPDGSLYKQDSKTTVSGTRIAILSPAHHAKPELITEAKPTPVANSDDSLVRVTAAKLDRELNLTPGSSSTTNWGGIGEKWVRGNGKWYFITPDGTLTLWDGISGPRNSTAPKGTTIAKLDGRFHEDVTRLTEAEKKITETEKTFAARSLLNNTSHNTLQDGVDIKWVSAPGNTWYFVRPNDEVFLWDRRRVIAEKTGVKASGTLIAALTGAYANPSSLKTPPSKPPGTAAYVNVLDDLFVDLPDFN